VLEGSKTGAAYAEQMLADAYELVLSGWCQGVSAEDELGRAIEPSSAFARKWSLSGALERIWRRGVGDPDAALDAFERANLAIAASVKDVPQRWNDALDRTKDDVLDALQEAVRVIRRGYHGPASLVEDLLDDLDRYEGVPGFMFEKSP
jgi:hypothetical protein